MSAPESSSLSPPRASRRLDWLDALRGWAVFGVVLVHSGHLAKSFGFAGQVSAAGQYGVQLFFLISALTISMTYESHIGQYGTTPRSQFAWFIKRFFRIAPLYYLAALFYPVENYAKYIATRHHLGLQISVPNILANLTFLHTWIPSANNTVVPGGWSIGVEMFFYGLVPFIWLILPIRRRIAVLLFSIAGLLTITLLVSKAFTQTYYVEDNSYLYYWFPAEAPTIIFGLIFFFLYGKKLGNPISRSATALSQIGFVFLLAAGLYVGTVKEVAPVLAPTILGAAFVLMIFGLQGWMKHIAVHPLSIFLGRISFSVYILHFVVLDAMAFVLQKLHINRSSELAIIPIAAATLIITSGLALLSKRIVEDPAIKYGHQLSRQFVLGRTQAH